MTQIAFRWRREGAAILLYAQMTAQNHFRMERR